MFLENTIRTFKACNIQIVDVIETNNFSAKSQHFGSSEIASKELGSFGLDDQGPSIGIEELFRDFERPENSDPKIQTEPLIESSFGLNDIGLIQPSTVVR